MVFYSFVLQCRCIVCLNLVFQWVSKSLKLHYSLMLLFLEVLYTSVSGYQLDLKQRQ